MSSSVDDIWAQLQEEDSNARKKSSKKEKKIQGAKKGKIKDAPPAAPVPKAPAPAESSVADKEITPENVSQHVHFHIRSIIGGNVGERKTSLKLLARRTKRRPRPSRHHVDPAKTLDRTPPDPP